MKKILITGATGFIGRQCLPFLREQNYEVHAVTSSMRNVKASQTTWHHINLLDDKLTRDLLYQVRPSHLLHLAWFGVPGIYWDSLENFRWLHASLNLLHCFAQNGGKRVVMAGSCAEYDWDYGYCSEKVTPLQPVTGYGMCKHSLQSLIAVYAKKTGISAAWGRIFFLYGPHENPARLISSVICSILKNEPARCSHGKQIRDFLHVKDVASALVALLQTDVQGAVNIASGIPVAVKDVVQRVAKMLGREDLVQLGALQIAASDPPLLVADVRRLNEEVGWKPEIAMDFGLEQTIHWWKNHSGEGKK